MKPVNVADSIIKQLAAFKILAKPGPVIDDVTIVTGFYKGQPFSVAAVKHSKGTEYRVYRGHDLKYQQSATNMLSQLHKFIERAI